MDKLVIFNIGKGSFEQGFPVILQISEESQLPYTDMKDGLPPAPEIPELYQQWQDKYYGLEPMRRVIKIHPAQITNFSSRKDCEEAAEALEARMKEWFNQPSLLNLRRHLLDEVGQNESARIIFQTQDELLKKLPWHLWDVFERRPNAEFSLSARYAPPSEPLKLPVKILALLGGDEGLNVQEDRDLLEKLPRANVTLLEKPSREKLNDELWEKPWDILFFAGHSSSYEEGNSGVIQINETDSLSLNQLRNALKKAKQNGLKLAILNSCDGLGLAQSLADLQIPLAIVMREPVPDRVAQKFLQYFLKSFSKGESFDLAVRQAREKLQGIEDQFPCASWLPVICQNPAEKTPIWPQSPISRVRTKIRQIWRSHKATVFAGIAIAIAIVVVIHNVSEKSRTISALPGPSEVSLPAPALANRFSKGERLLLRSNINSNQEKEDREKEKGINAFANGDFDDAIKHFVNSLRNNKNDPETLIYLNNAIAEQKVKTNTGSKLEIAVSVPIGRESNVAREVLRGIAQAQTQLNCTLEEISRAVEEARSNVNCNGGIEGKLLQITIANDDDNPDLVEQIAEAIAENQNILGVIGHYSSDSTLKGGGVYAAKGLVVISPTSTAVNLSNFSDWVFRTIPSDTSSAKELMHYMLNKLNTTRVAVAYHRNSTYSESLKNEFQKQLPSRKFVAECDLSQGNFSAGDCVNLAKQNQAEVLFLVPGTKDSLEKAFLVVNSNNGTLKLLGGGDMYNSRMLLDSGENAAKGEMTITVPWHNPSSAFAKTAETFWQGGVNWRTAMAYDATQAMAEGLRRINGTPDRWRLRQELSSSDFSAEGATGKVEFEPSGDRKSFSNIDVLVQVQPNPNPGAKFPYRFTLLKQPSR